MGLYDFNGGTIKPTSGEAKCCSFNASFAFICTGFEIFVSETFCLHCQYSGGEWDFHGPHLFLNIPTEIVIMVGAEISDLDKP